MDDQLRTYRAGSRSFTGFSFWRVAENSASVKSPEILAGVAVVPTNGLTFLSIRVELTRG